MQLDAKRKSRRSAKSEKTQSYKLSPPRPILLIPPLAGFRQESPPLDEVHFLRDEGANIVWAVEHTVSNQLGRPVSGFDAQRERYERWRDALQILLSRLQRFVDFGSPSDVERMWLEKTISDVQNHITDLSPYARPTPSQKDVMRYRLATTVPENWIPFIPVSRGSTFGADSDAIQFRRAKMLRNSDHSKMEGNPFLTLSQVLELHKILDVDPSLTLTKVVERCPSPTSLHHFALDTSIPSMSRLLTLDENALLFINEESIPRAGLRVQFTKQRARWVDGSTHVWVGRKVLTGRGEGCSGLKFDYLKE
jgi:hypothetical protein